MFDIRILIRPRRRGMPVSQQASFQHRSEPFFADSLPSMAGVPVSYQSGATVACGKSRSRRICVRVSGAFGSLLAYTMQEWAQETIMNDIYLTFPGGKRVEATVGRHHIVTDQTLAHGGDDSAPEPFELFLASLA